MTILTFQNFSKRRNSTKRPLDSAGTSVNVNLKDSTSIESPVFELASNDFTINYVKAFGAYYFVNDIVSVVNGIIELHCQKDVLATFKDDIGNYTAFVERAASSYDVTIHDTAISQKTSYAQKITGATVTMLASEAKRGLYVIRTAGRNGVNSYAITASDLADIMDYCYNPSNSDYVNFTGDVVRIMLQDPFHYITDLRWIGLTDGMVSSVTGSGSSYPTRAVMLGWFAAKDGNNSPITGHVVQPSAYYPTSVVHGSVDVPAISNYFNDFRDWSSDWTKYTLYVPGCGSFPVDGLAVKDGISIDYGIDLITGDMGATVYRGAVADTGKSVLMTLSGKAGCPVQIGQVAPNSSAIIQTVEAGVKAWQRKEMPDLQEIVTGIQAVTQPTPSTIGANGSPGQIQFMPDAFLTKYIYDSAGIPLAVQGRPLCQNVTLSTLSGFVKCGGASLDIAGEGGDKDAVNAFLNGGFYYE